MNSIYTHTNQEGITEEVQLEEWAWLALYSDGTSLKQFDETTGEFHQFKEIELDKLETFVVLNTHDSSNSLKRYEIHIEEGMTPIFFYRTTVFNMKQPNETKVRLPYFGYKENINGQAVKTILSVHPSGATAIQNTDGRNKS